MLINEDCRIGRHTWTAWTTVLDVLLEDLQVVTLMRTCVLCGYAEDARGAAAERAA